MITNIHRTIADTLVSDIRPKGWIQRSEIRKKFKSNLTELDLVVSWLIKDDIIQELNHGMNYGQGSKFLTYSTLDQVLSPKTTHSTIVNSGQIGNLNTGHNYGTQTFDSKIKNGEGKEKKGMIREIIIGVIIGIAVLLIGHYVFGIG